MAGFEEPWASPLATARLSGKGKRKKRGPEKREAGKGEEKVEKRGNVEEKQGEREKGKGKKERKGVRRRGKSKRKWSKAVLRKPWRVPGHGSCLRGVVMSMWMTPTLLVFFWPK